MSEIRLHVLLSRAGVASRRKAEAFIKEGRVRVNGHVVQTLGAKADPERDEVAVDGVSVGARQPPTTLALNKPVEVVTTLSDPEARETVADLVADEPYRFLPVGRLDYHTEGLLLMTTDGELSHRLLHPRYHVPKVYQVKVRGRPDRSAIDQLREGVLLDDGPTRPAVVQVLEEGPRWTWLEIVIAEGRNRLVRRMCDEVGHPALRVIRTELATIGLSGLKPGQFRYLEPAELAALYKTADLPVPAEMPERATLAQRRVLGLARRGKGPLPNDPDRRPRREATPVDAGRGSDTGRPGAGRRTARGAQKPRGRERRPDRSDERPDRSDERRSDPRASRGRPSRRPERNGRGFDDDRYRDHGDGRTSAGWSHERSGRGRAKNGQSRNRADPYDRADHPFDRGDRSARSGRAAGRATGRATGRASPRDRSDGAGRQSDRVDRGARQSGRAGRSARSADRGGHQDDRSAEFRAAPKGSRADSGRTARGRGRGRAGDGPRSSSGPRVEARSGARAKARSGGRPGAGAGARSGARSGVRGGTRSGRPRGR